MKLRARTFAGMTCLLLTAASAPVWAQEAIEAEELVMEETGAAPPEDADAAEPEGSEVEGDLETYWSQRLLRGKQRIELARERAEKAEADYSRARHDRDARGERLLEIKERRVAAEREVLDAEASLPRLVEQARRAGVSPGTLRDYWDEE